MRQNLVISRLEAAGAGSAYGAKSASTARAIHTSSIVEILTNSQRDGGRITLSVIMESGSQELSVWKVEPAISL